MAPLLTVLAGPSTSLRDDLVRCLVLRRPGLVAVAYDVEVGAGVRGGQVHGGPVHGGQVHGGPVHGGPVHGGPVHGGPVHGGPVHGAPVHGAPVHGAPVHGATSLGRAPHLVRRVLDARGTQQREEVPLSRCCLSCTVREDAGAALALVAASGRWPEAVLALPSAVQPGAVAAALSDEAELRVDGITTVVDALLLRQQLSGDDVLAERGLAVAPTDRRSTAELVVAQLEDADVLAVADLHRVATSEARTVEALLSHLAPLAMQVLLAPGGVGVEQVVSTGRRGSGGGLQERGRLLSLAAELCPPSCGVTTVVWRSARPLHAARLHAALPHLVADVVRSRGHVWLTDRPQHRVRWESAGGSLSLGEPTRWDGLPGCALVLTGLGLDEAALRARLDACSADDDELLAAAADVPRQDALGPS